jgi:D-alanine--poly(phosphoribitol) ligase subunit 1
MFTKFVLTPILNSLTNYSTENSFFIDETYFTYKDLAIKVSTIRTKIQELSYAGRNIGLIANDDIETYSSIIAIWLEGYSYVPIHPRHPLERGLEVIDQAEIELIIDSSDEPAFKSKNIIQSKNLSFKSLNLNPKQVDDDATAYILRKHRQTKRGPNHQGQCGIIYESILGGWL